MTAEGAHDHGGSGSGNDNGGWGSLDDVSGAVPSAKCEVTRVRTQQHATFWGCLQDAHEGGHTGAKLHRARSFAVAVMAGFVLLLGVRALCHMRLVVAAASPRWPASSLAYAILGAVAGGCRCRRVSAAQLRQPSRS
eukprot:SAG11_NODE_1081_length_5956_cov_14.482506_7_plen_137_part_00